MKVVAYLYVFMWLRFTFPRYRFDQLMRLGLAVSDSALALVNVIVGGNCDHPEAGNGLESILGDAADDDCHFGRCDVACE